MPIDWVPGEGPLPGLKAAAFPLCPLGAEKDLSSSSYKVIHLIPRAPPSGLHLILPKAPSVTITLETEIQI